MCWPGHCYTLLSYAYVTSRVMWLWRSSHFHTDTPVSTVTMTRVTWCVCVYVTVSVLRQAAGCCILTQTVWHWAESWQWIWCETSSSKRLEQSHCHSATNCMWIGYRCFITSWATYSRVCVKVVYEQWPHGVLVYSRSCLWCCSVQFAIIHY